MFFLPKMLGKSDGRPLPSRTGAKLATDTLSYFSMVNVAVRGDEQPGKLLGTIKIPEKYVRQKRLSSPKTPLVNLKPSAGRQVEETETQKELTTVELAEKLQNILKNFGKQY